MNVAASTFINRSLLITAMLVCGSGGSGCDQAVPSQDEYIRGLREGREKKIEFYGRVVYEDGTPAEGAVVSVNTSSIKPVEIQLSTTSEGAFEVFGSGSSLRIESIRGSGSWLYEESPIQTDQVVPYNMGYNYNPQPGSWYVPSKASPAVFVLVRQGHRGVTAWPSRGGQDCGVNGRCVVNVPMVPKQPSVDIAALAAGGVERDRP